MYIAIETTALQQIKVALKLAADFVEHPEDYNAEMIANMQSRINRALKNISSLKST